MIIIVTQPQSGTYEVGEFLTVVATGGSFRYQWQKQINNVWTDITNETNSTMRVIWGGTYRVVITEQSGAIVTGIIGTFGTEGGDTLSTESSDTLYVGNSEPLITNLANPIIATSADGSTLASDSAVVVAESVFDDLIYDRVLADVERVKTLRSRIEAGVATVGEIAEWNSNMKGSYNYTDLNRIEEALAFVKTYSSWFGKTITYPTDPSQSWVANTFPTSTNLNKILTNVNVVKTVWQFTDNLPTDFDKISYTEANQIEKLLHKVREVTE